jgi:hypothetical protein
MSFSTTKLICGAAIIGLSACGGAGGGGASGAAGAAAALNYDPVFATSGNPTIGASKANSGVTGVAILTDGFNDRIAFESVQIRMSNDGETLTLTINDRSYTLDEDPDTPNFYSNGELVMAFNPDDGDFIYEFGSSGITGGDFGLRSGFVGVETPVAALAGGEILYRGSLIINLDATGDEFDIDQISGTLEITTNFDDGAMSGEYLFGLLDTLGTVTGSTQGNGILGTLTLEDASGYSGDLQIIAKAFGQDGDTLAGVTGGTGIVSDTTGIDYNGEGVFELEEVPF